MGRIRKPEDLEPTVSARAQPPPGGPRRTSAKSGQPTLAAVSHPDAKALFLIRTTSAHRWAEFTSVSVMIADST